MNFTRPLRMDLQHKYKQSEYKNVETYACSFIKICTRPWPRFLFLGRNTLPTSFNHLLVTPAWVELLKHMFNRFQISVLLACFVLVCYACICQNHMHFGLANLQLEPLLVCGVKEFFLCFEPLMTRHIFLHVERLLQITCSCKFKVSFLYYTQHVPPRGRKCIHAHIDPYFTYSVLKNPFLSIL